MVRTILPALALMMPHPAKQLTATYESEMKPNSAWIYLQQISDDDTENIDFVTLYLEMLSGIQPPAGTGKTKEKQEILLRNMANNTGCSQSVLAQSLIAKHYAEPFDKTPMVPPQLRLNATFPVSGIHLYPNPAKNEVQLFLTIPEMLNGTKLYVSDMSGRLIDQLTVNQAQFTLQTTNYPNGFYLLYVKTTSGKVYTQKLAVIH
ncbi:MAG: T9SS type A sorting domain-containing protein [Sphingobacteriales bacterium]|nr:MAG: T9SS type A sorting domain-containing protein [Sphingobacteriales bacterium]